jgi:hypothetical protein
LGVMKKILLALSFVFVTSLTFGQFNPVKNLHFCGGGYQYGNYNCPQFNCFLICWNPPDSAADTLVAYKMFENDSLYMTFAPTVYSYGCDGYPTSGCSFNYPDFLWFLTGFPGTAYPFNCTVKAVYDKDSILSIATDFLHFNGIAIGINEIQLKHHFSISPNPFNTSTQITLDKTYHNISLSVYDIQGKLMLQKQYADCSQIQLNRNGLNNGMYFLKLTLDERGVETGKIVVSE